MGNLKSFQYKIIDLVFTLPWDWLAILSKLSIAEREVNSVPNLIQICLEKLSNLFLGACFYSAVGQNVQKSFKLWRAAARALY